MSSPIIWGANAALNLHPSGGELDTVTGRYRVDNGAKNYIGFNNFENNSTTGWTLGVTGALTNGLPTATPTFGSGASGTLAISVVSSGQLSNLYSLSYADSAITTAGNMVASSALAIDIEDQAKVLTWKFSYKAQTNPTNGNWSGTSSNSFAVAVYDVTNSSWLSSAGNFNIVQSSGVGICTGTCQTNATTASIRFVIYNANASAGAITIYFDSFYLGPQTSPQAPVITDWVAYTPTFVGLGTVGATNVKSRRVGDSIEVVGNVVSGISTGTTASMTVGYNGANANIVVDTSKVAPGAIVGMAGQSGSTTTYFGESVLAPASNLTTVNFGSQTSTTSLLTNVVGSSLVATAGTLAFEFKVPIVGWSSNSVSSADTDTRVVAMRAHASTGASMGTLTTTPINTKFDTVDVDTHGAFNTTTGIYTVPVTGYYNIAASMFTTGTTVSGLAIEFQLVTGVPVTLAFNQTVVAGAVTTGIVTPLVVNAMYMTAGTQILMQSLYAGTYTGGAFGTSTTANYFSIARVSGPAVINATESVNAIYTDTAGSAIAASAATYTFATKIKDTHNAYSGGTYTVPVSGTYLITSTMFTASQLMSTANNFSILIKQNATQKAQGQTNGTGGTQSWAATVSTMLSCNAGDAIIIQPANSTGATTAATTAGLNTFSISRVGN